MDELSKLDQKIARDKLLSDIESLWEALYAAINTVAGKLNRAYGRGLTVERNDHSSLIQVKRPTTMRNDDTEVGRHLEIQFDRTASKVIVTIIDGARRIGTWGLPPTRGEPFTFRIDANTDLDALVFVSSSKYEQRPYTPIELAEHLLTERLLDMKLPP
jgi:hypothetical protein